MQNTSCTDKTIYLQITFLLILSFAISFPYIGGGSLSSWDEAIFAQAARGIIRTGNWITLYWNGHNWLDKPPLHIWTVAIFYKILGINEFAARLTSVLFGVATIIGLYLIVLGEYDKHTAFISSLVLLSTLHFIRFSRLCMSDIMLTFIIMLSLYFFWRGIKNRKFFIFSGILFGCAIMTKWTVAFLIPFIIMCFIIFSKQFDLVKNKILILGFALGILIAVPWHVYQLLHNTKFITDYLSFHSIRRLTTALDGHTGNWMFYIKTISNKGRPLGVLGLLGIPYLVWSYINKKDKFLLLVLIWILTFLAAFSAAQTKLHWYIMPIYPAVSIVCAVILSKIIKPRFVWIFVLITVILTSFYIRHYDIFNMDYNNETKAFSATAREIIGKQPLYLYKTGDPGIGFYFGDYAIWVKNPSSFEELLSEPVKKYFIMERRQFEELKSLKEMTKVIAESKKIVLFSNK